MSGDQEPRQTPRERLLGAARAVLAREGLEGLTLRAIAREAGVSHGAPLRHFPNLPALVAALSAEGYRGLMAEVGAAVSAVGGDGPAAPRRRLAAAGHGYLRFALHDPHVFGLMFRPERSDTSDPDYQAAGAASFGQLRGLVAEAQAEGWHDDVATDRLTTVLWANMHGLAQLWLHGAAQLVAGTDDVHDLVGIDHQIVLDL